MSQTVHLYTPKLCTSLNPNNGGPGSNNKVIKFMQICKSEILFEFCTVLVTQKYIPVYFKEGIIFVFTVEAMKGRYTILC